MTHDNSTKAQLLIIGTVRSVHASHLALTCGYFGFSLVEKGPIAHCSLVQGDLRVAERVADAEGASLRYDAATQLHVERRHAAG